MTDHWQNESGAKAQVVDDDDAPDDWEAALDDKPEVSADVEQKPATTTKSSKKKERLIQEPDGDYTPEQLDAIKQKGELQEEHNKVNDVAQLVDKDNKVRSLDDMDLYTREEFIDYSLRLANHLKVVATSEFFPAFIDNLLDGLTKPMSTDGVKRLAASLQAVTIRKQSDERERKAKSKAKKQTKPQLRSGRQSDYSAFATGGGHDYDQDDDYDEDDFM